MASFPPSYDGGTAMVSRPKRHCTIKSFTKRSTVTRARACQACEFAHHKCMGVPCDRCFKLSLRCRPSPKLGAAADSTQPLLELLLKRDDGQAMANQYMQQFGLVLREGLVDRDVVVQLLRVWRARSIVADIDVSYGLAGYISKQLGVLPMEMEGEGDLAWEAPESVRRMRLVEEAQRVAATGSALKESDLFQRLDDGVTPLCLSVVCRQGGFTMASNGRFEALFRKTSDMLADTDVRKRINSFTAAAIVAPEDRDTVFFNMVHLFCCHSRKKRVAFFKMVDRVEERPRLFLFSGWQETLPDGSLVVVQRLEPVPRSRHISDVPQVMCVVKKFRKSTPTAEVLGKAARAVAGGGGGGGGAAAAEGEVIEAVDGCTLIEQKKDQEKEGNEMGAAGKGAADGFGGLRSLACVFPLATDPQGAGIELRESIPFMLPAAAAAAARDLFKPVDLTRDIAAPPPLCPGIDCLPFPAPLLLSPLPSSSLTSSSSSVAAGAKTRVTTTNIIASTEGYGPSTSMPLPLVPPALPLEEGREGREGGEEELLLDEGLEDLEVFLNDAVMSEIFYLMRGRANSGMYLRMAWLGAFPLE